MEKKDKAIKKVLDRLRLSYIELTSYRNDYNILNKALLNPFTVDTGLESSTKKLKILKSHFISTAVEIFSRGLKFPNFEIKSKNTKDIKSYNLEKQAKGLLEWFIRTTEYEDVYTESKENWAAFGDGYRMPYARPIKRKRIRSNKVVGRKKVFRPGVEDVDGTNILFDVSATDIMSESAHKKISFYAITNTLSEEQIIGTYGKWILKHIKEGAMVDVDSISKLESNSGERTTKYYEVIKYQSWAEEEEFELIGANAFPYIYRREGVSIKTPKELEGKVYYSDEYIHRNTYGEAIITLWNTYFYYNRSGVRNYGLALKLFGTQVAHEILENAKLAATRKRLFEVVAILGGSSQSLKGHLDEFESKYQDNILTFLHLPSNVQNIMPQANVLRFDSMPAQDAEQTTADIHSFARNAVGVSLTRLEVQKNIGVGQSEILQEEKTLSVAQIIDRNIQNLRKEFTGMLDYTINMKGFGSEETIDIIQKTKIAGETRPIVIEGSVSMKVKDIAKSLREYAFSVYIDKDSIVNRSQIAQTQRLIDFFGTIDPSVLPGLSKKIAKRIGDILRLDINIDELEGIENSKAQGGKSQFTQNQNDKNVQGVLGTDTNL